MTDTIKLQPVPRVLRAFTDQDSPDEWETLCAVVRNYAREAVLRDRVANFRPTEQASRRAQVVPQFNQVAKKKLDYLLEAGEEITGYAIQNKDGRRGAIDCHGFVYWWQDAATPQPPEANSAEFDRIKAAPVQMPSPAECNTMDCKAGS